ncbi:C4-dicarboxylate TRAP transporter substrate-binding protein [Oceanobacillus sp. CFH 90083]|uniref:C4-dicarboxylate TRAP transporter substrate-binding protein n=1 Tax=Oceanobacillus sp. CFH 90083 TaxID=2592336 RepID=UPI00128C923A|nr:C4-dicarboxylate TRAP transporter substrate-binding protein [Oceanobacillus sp. CFH 90083]
MKKLYCFLLVAVGLVLLTACGSEGAEGNDGEYTLRLGVTQNEQNAEYQAIYQFKEAVEERSAGEIEVETYHSDQLANIPDLIEQASLGADVGTVTDAAQLSDLKKEFSIIQSPFMFEDISEMEQFLESDLYQEWVEEFTEQGIRILSFNFQLGERNLATTHPVTNAADFKGSVIRTSGAEIVNATVSAMGGSPTGMPWTEAYPGLEQGVIDGVEAHNTAIYESSMYEVINHIAKTNHYQLVSALIVSEEWFDSLPEEFQEIVLEEAKAAGETASEMSMESSNEYEGLMKEAGVEFHEVDREEFKELADSVYETMGLQEIRDEVNAVLGK